MKYLLIRNLLLLIGTVSFLAGFRKKEEVEQK